MKLCLQIPRFDWPGSPENTGTRLGEIASAADVAGLASIWVMDHFFQIQTVGKPDEPMLESYSALNYMAAVTKNIRLGAMVGGGTYRTPGFLVKSVTTLDVLSGGRAWLGIGAGWNEREALGLGLPFPPLKERFERLEETLQIAKRAWAGDFSAYDGKHFHLKEPIVNPQPLSKPHPPILIGGGEQKTLRLVAQYANACNLFAFGDFSVVAQKLDVLKRHCEAVGRDYDTIERTVLLVSRAFPNGLPPSLLIEMCRKLAKLGVQHVIISDLPKVHTITPLEVIGREVVGEIADL